MFAEPKALLPLLQDAGIYGVVAYLCAFALFYASAVPIAEVGYHAVSGTWYDPCLFNTPREGVARRAPPRWAPEVSAPRESA